MTPLSLNFSGRRATPLVLQCEAAECGLACLAMVLGHHGYRTDMATLRHRFSLSSKGVTLAQLIAVAGRVALTPRPVKVALENLDKLTLPAVLHWDFNHFVVLTRVRNGGRGFVVHDPARGRLTLDRDDMSRHFTGVALELSPAVTFEPQVRRQRLKLSQLLGRLPGLGRALTQIFLLALVLETFVIASPFYSQLVIDSALIAEDRELLLVLALGFGLLVLIQVGVTLLRAWGMMVLGVTVNRQLNANLFRHLLRLPMSFFGKRHLGDLMSRFDSLGEVQRTLTTAFIEALLDGLMALTTLAMMYLYSPALATLVLGAALLYAALRLVLFRPLRRAQEEQIHFGAKQQSCFLETARAVQGVKLFNRQDQRLALYQNRMVETFNAGIRVQKLQMLFQACNGLLFGAENILVILLAALMILDGQFTIGMLFAFIAYKQQFTGRVRTLIDNLIAFKMLDLHLERVGDIALAAPEPDSGAEAADGAARQDDHSIEVRNLSYAYSAVEAPVLQNLNLRIEPGESVAVVGPSGCGKSTLLNLLLGLLQPSGGDVLIGGVPLQRLSARRFRDQVGAVMQDDQLLAGSVAENISFFDPEADPDWIRHCAGLAAVADEIEAMPMGYNTLIGDMGAALSGGQKQRILLARALYKKPKILFLDEATSHLDVTRERLVNRAIASLRITRVVIAHRPETIAAADRVINLGAEAFAARQTQPHPVFSARRA